MPTVLVVDDEDDHLFVVSMSFRQIGGWQVFEASDGHDAVEIARTSAPDAILLDLIMPGLDGIAVFQALQGEAATRAIPVVLLTASRSVGQAQLLDGLGVAGVLMKPFSAKELPARFADLIGWAPPVRQTEERPGGPRRGPVD
ncbi:response regulator [Nocardioides sp. AX2bis]|uniref:response regulator n=1 Tax=Nocardioides sp. AX2bis TaxID=2653157 RepID=UPI0012F10B23|nr:response regulator [Nocardioides sp. AX2bis]VXC47935.1 Transcriptional regulatory protein SrrA [Nocardioides sp. AX2bis]